MRLLLPLLCLVACKKPVEPVTPPAPAVMLPIAAINDFHGALYEKATRDDPTRATGGLPWFVAAMDSLREEEPDLVLLDGGDLFQGPWPINQSAGAGSIAAFNLLKVDVAAVGNHDFDYGDARGEGKRGALEEAVKEADFHWVAANISNADGSPWAPEGFAPWVLFERKGLQVGVLGLTTQDTPQTTLLANVDDLVFGDVVEAVKQSAAELEEAGADVVIAVGHLTGHCETPAYDKPPTDCTPDGEIGRLIDELEPGTLDVIVAGHAHTLFANRYKDTFVLEARAKGQVINRLDLAVGPEGVRPDASVIHEPWVLSHDTVDPGCEDRPFPTDPLEVGGRMLTPSAEALTLIDELETQSGSLCDEVGCAAAPLGRTREAESGVGDWVSDAMLHTMDADVALTNSGGLRADLPSGTLRGEHIQAVMPFDNRLVVVEMTGERLREMLRIGSSGAHGILQIAGGTYHFDPERTEGTDRNGDGQVEEWEQDRLCSATIGGEDIDPARTYRVVTVDFLVGGGDHFGPVFDGLDVADQGPLLREALVQHLGSLGECLGTDQPLPAPEAPRIRRGPC